MARGNEYVSVKRSPLRARTVASALIVGTVALWGLGLVAGVVAGVRTGRRLRGGPPVATT